MTLKEEFEKKRRQYESDAQEVLRYTRFDLTWGLYIGGFVEGDCYRRDMWYEAMLNYVNENISEINKRASAGILKEIE